MKQIVSGNIKCFDISCSDENIEKSMNKPIGIRCADIYLRFPEIMEDEANDLADFLEDEHIVYEGATDVFMEKDKEIERLKNGYCELKEKCNNGECDCTNEEYDVMAERNMKLSLEVERLNNIINELEKYIDDNYFYDDVGMKIFDVSLLEDKIKELKGSDNNE